MSHHTTDGGANRSTERSWRRGLGWLLLLGIAGCLGWATRPTAITSTGATLHAQASCTADTTNNGCAGWFQYWADGSGTILETDHLVANINTNGYFDYAQAISGLTPNALYHYQFCGYGDSNNPQPGLCAGPQPLSGVNAPGTLPDAGNLNAATNFRTATASTKGTFDLGRPLSTADTEDKPISRDGGISVQFSSNPPQALWIFGDTQQNHVGFIPFGTAAAGPFTPGEAPTALNELPSPPAPPQPGRTGVAPFFPQPAAMQRTNGTPCAQSGSYQADWLAGGAQVPGSSSLLLLYGELCIETTPLAFTEERLALAEYDPATNVFLRVDHPFVASPLSAGLPAQKALGSPIFSGGYLYLYAGDGTNFYVARVQDDAAHWSNGANFKWWTGSAWNSNSALAATILPGVGGGHVADYSATTSKKFVLITQTGFGTGGFQAYTATSPRGPWTLGPAAQPPDACTGGGFGCYALTGHPELSTTSLLVYSWLSPDDRDGYGHIRIGAVPW